MDVTAHLRAAPGELVAYDLPAGPHWVEILAAHAESGASFLPVDQRLTEREKRRLLDRAGPTVVVHPDGEDLFAPEGMPAEPDRDWAVVATSGSTGEPKLAELSRGALGAAVGGSLEALGIGADDPWIACLTPAHVGGLLVYLRSAFGGAPLTFHERFDPQTLRSGAPPGAHVALVPTMLHRLVEAHMDLSRFGVLLVGGGRLDPALRDAAGGLGARVVSTYGLTETGGGIVYDGIPFEGTHVRIAQDGGLELRGPTLMDGYRHDPAATATALTSDGWLRSGDRGEVESDGRLRALGRADDAIRTGAETVWPDEVEAVLRTHPKVADVAVAGRPDPEWGERVAAFVVAADPGDPPTLEALRDHCRDALARFKAPRQLTLVGSIPRTPGGKLRRSELR